MPLIEAVVLHYTYTTLKITRCQGRTTKFLEKPRNDAQLIYNHPRLEEFAVHEQYNFRMPGTGMIFLASIDFGINLEESWIVGDASENEQTAPNAKLRGFMPSDIWVNRFKPGMYEVRNVSFQQVQFLENLRESFDNN